MNDQEAAAIVKDSLLLSGAIYGLIEGIDTKIYPIPGPVKSALSWVVSLVSPYIYYGMLVAQGQQQFSFWILLMLGTVVKTGAEVARSAGDKGVPVVITEWGISLCDKKPMPHPIEEVHAAMCQEYPQWLRQVRQYEFVEAAYVYILGGTEQWAGFRVTEDVVRALRHEGLCAI
ncbi:MAG TPA: hypothetical protein VEW94_11675 [Chloroflexia bacterium]|nr:hypothetical protein [Chloroflexia bacterium]